MEPLTEEELAFLQGCFDLARDGVAVRGGDGALVAWATVLALPTVPAVPAERPEVAA